MNKGNKQKINGEFKQLQTKIFIRTAVILFAAVLLTFSMYSFVLAGHFANGVVSFLTLFVGDYDAALDIYSRVIRDNMDFFVLIAILIIFLMILRIYRKRLVSGWI